jgi:mitochondrial fission protein ELM1
LLIGGNTRNFTFTSEDNQQLLAFLRNSHRHDKTEWHVTNSHNTPHDLSDALARTEVYPLGPIKEFIDVRRSGPGTVRQIIDKSDVLLCTEDSSTMISEAIQSRRPVLGLSPNHWKLPAQEQGYRRYLTERGWTRSLAIADLSPDRVAQELAKVTPMTTNALADLADLLCAQIPDLIPHEDRHPLS